MNNNIENHLINQENSIQLDNKNTNLCFICSSNKDKLVRIDKNFLNYMILNSSIIRDEMIKHMETNNTIQLNYKLEVIQKNSEDLKILQRNMIQELSASINCKILFVLINFMRWRK